MMTAMAVLLLITLNTTPPSAQVPHALKAFLETQTPIGSTSRPVDYKVSYASFREGKPKGQFKESGTLFVGTTREGTTWASAPQHAYDPQFGGEAPSSEGQIWFSQAASPSKLSALADPGSVLFRFVRRLEPKTEETPSAGHGEPGDKILVYPLEAARPAAKFWTFKMKAGEARLHVKKDGTPVSLEVIQAYGGKLSPHFGEYLLDHRETWTFSVDTGRLQTTKYQLSLHRQDWKDSAKAQVEMIIGGLR
jgi:hypothetical protein